MLEPSFFRFNPRLASRDFVFSDLRDALNQDDAPCWNATAWSCASRAAEFPPASQWHASDPNIPPDWPLGFYVDATKN